MWHPLVATHVLQVRIINFRPSLIYSAFATSWPFSNAKEILSWAVMAMTVNIPQPEKRSWKTIIFARKSSNSIAFFSAKTISIPQINKWRLHISSFSGICHQSPYCALLVCVMNARAKYCNRASQIHHQHEIAAAKMSMATLLLCCGLVWNVCCYFGPSQSIVARVLWSSHISRCLLVRPLDTYRPLILS